jgi:hypothetical protein
LERRLAAIAVADVVGYSYFMEVNEAGTLRKRCNPSSEDGPNRTSRSRRTAERFEDGSFPKL